MSPGTAVLDGSIVLSPKQILWNNRLLSTAEELLKHICPIAFYPPSTRREIALCLNPVLRKNTMATKSLSYGMIT